MGRNIRMMEKQSRDNTEQTVSSESSSYDPPLPKKTLIARLVYWPYMLLFLGILCFFDIGQRIEIAIRGARSEFFYTCLNRTLVASLRLLGTRIKFEHESPLDPKKLYIIVSNHQSMLDMPLLVCVLGYLRPRYVAKKELAKGSPGISIRLRNDGSALIDRKDARQALPEIKKLGKRMLENGFSAILFPEGTRSRSGSIKEFRPAGFTTLAKSVPDAEIVPVTIEGSWPINAYKLGPIPLGQTIVVRVSPPIARDEKDLKKLLQKARTEIANNLEEIRKTS
jgi:1-acyl-sn-glycerol-3-phosphate acyltransferase